MNRIQLNTIGDSPVVVKKGSQVQSQEKTVEITENGTTEVVPDAGYALSKVTVNTNVESGGSTAKWTGHADAEGLRAIGWTDEDIAYYQANGVNWNEEDDEYHKVTEDNKALYGVLTADNISTYKDRIVYLPKIDTSGKTSMRQMFQYCYSLVAIPLLDTSGVTSMESLFNGCYSLVSVPQLDTSKNERFYGMFRSCYSLVSAPQLDTSKAIDSLQNMFYNCYSLVSAPIFSLLDDSVSSIFNMCYSLKVIPFLDFSNITSITNDLFGSCNSLTYIKIKNLGSNIKIHSSSLLSKDSLLYIINNEAATSAITITLAAYAYTRLAEDADVVAALANHPNISLASA